ncbi:MAG: polyprenol monophosphomannose synthase [Actinobacteria bacterium]|nr:polyprenol monophosphomannose synthase [Actinomycetota bacterium]MCB9388966.1 polyprenol monophosphomannose synthase [Acidimicrobiia bacterium]
MPQTLVMIPTYNEAANIEVLLNRVASDAPGVSVLVLDDNSPDGTGMLAERWAEQNAERLSVSVLHRSAKEGLGPAYLAGYEWGLQRGFDVMIQMDADGSHDPSVIPRLVNEIDAGADLVIGSRYVPGGTIPTWSWHRLALSRFGNGYSSAMLGLHIKDTTAGYRAYAAPLLARMDRTAVRADGYGFQIEMAMRATDRGARIREIPIAFVDRTRGKSKMSSRIVVEALALVTWWGIKRRFARRRPQDV